MKITLKRIDSKFQFSSGKDENRVFCSASENLQGLDRKGQRPMELMLNGLAGCLSIDVLNILYKQKQEVVSFEVEVEAIRRDQIPSVFTDIHLVFKVKGEIREDFLSRAIQLGTEKYCSAYHSLSSDIIIRTSYVIQE